MARPASEPGCALPRELLPPPHFLGSVGAERLTPLRPAGEEVLLGSPQSSGTGEREKEGRREREREREREMPIPGQGKMGKGRDDFLVVLSRGICGRNTHTCTHALAFGRAGHDPCCSCGSRDGCVCVSRLRVPGGGGGSHACWGFRELLPGWPPRALTSTLCIGGITIPGLPERLRDLRTLAEVTQRGLGFGYCQAGYCQRLSSFCLIFIYFFLRESV